MYIFCESMYKYVCMFFYICMSICVAICIYVYMYVYFCMYVYLYLRKYVWIYMYVYLYIMRMCARWTYVYYLYIYIYTYICMHFIFTRNSMVTSILPRDRTFVWFSCFQLYFEYGSESWIWFSKNPNFRSPKWRQN